MTRRSFLQSTAVLGAGTALGLPGTAAAWSRREPTLRVLSIGVVGTIGGHDRQKVQEHPRAEIVGLCDVDRNFLQQAAAEHPDAFTCEDYREAFDRHGDRFDAVIVATPDHSHCSIMTRALADGKHVYGQKPLVQQLEELEILQRAIDARPQLVTQVGAQRIESNERRAAYHLLKAGVLGPIVEVHVAYGNGALAGGHYFADGTLGEPCDPPDGFNYDLWLNGAAEAPCRPDMVQRRWRSWWEYGGGQITDWVVHLTDVVFYAFPELTSPTQVCTRTPSRDLTHFHADRVSSMLTYPVSSDAFANSTCTMHFYDTGLKPDRGQLGIGEGEWPGGIFTVVVGRDATMVLGPSGPLEIWRDGTMTKGLELPEVPTLEPFNHWRAWVDAALGVDTPHHWAPFAPGLRCTEAGLLAVKAAKYPGQVLDWDRANLRFTNHEEATRTLVRRAYRDGFAPVRL
jgi:predicted dehydrogenase